MSKVTILGYQISNAGLSKDIELAWQLLKSGTTGNYLACINPHSMVVASRDKLFKEALIHANILVPDGFGIVLAAKVLKLPLKERVTGTEFFLALTEYAENKGGLKYFFLGSTNKVLGLIIYRLGKEYPSIKICGIYSPPFKEKFTEDENRKIIDVVNSSNPDILWVGMTAPKQEKWIYENRYKLNVPFMGAIGAAFDFYAGTKKRSSIFWQKLGLEWLPRFIREPKRLWERNLKSTPIFLYWVIMEKFKSENLRSII
jgi:N-acetylglucosaminyldiphosphoundecaprenol N-acetyl-beta-D-mannosaminyltransferase